MVSIQQGIFPDSLKMVQVTPIFKPGDKDNVSNYRAIYLVFKEITQLTHATLQLTRNITDSFEKGKYIFGVFIDLF